MVNKKSRKNKYLIELPAYNIFIVLILVVGLSVLGYYIMSSKATAPPPPASGTSPTPTATPVPVNSLPTVPTALSAKATSANQVSLDWQASTDDTAVAGFVILRNGTKIANVNIPGFNDTSVQASTSYKYQVQAYDDEQFFSAPSAEVVVTTPKPVDTSKPTVPTNLRAYPDLNSALVTWSASTDDNGVADYVISVGGQVFNTPMLQYSIIGLKSKTQYTLSVQARDSAGNLSDPATVKFTTTCKRFMWWCW